MSALYNRRYTWEDAMIDAQVSRRLSNGALLTGLKLARAINWAPTDPGRRRRPALYWKNDDAFKAVGLGRSTFYRRAQELKDAGFIKNVGNNLHPCLPTSSSPETMNLQDETPSSQVEITKSHGGQPYSEDLCSEDFFSDDLLSDSASASLLHRGETSSLTSKVKPNPEGSIYFDDEDTW